jgi:hypothetical protein
LPRFTPERRQGYRGFLHILPRGDGLEGQGVIERLTFHEFPRLFERLFPRPLVPRGLGFRQGVVRQNPRPFFRPQVHRRVRGVADFFLSDQLLRLLAQKLHRRHAARLSGLRGVLRPGKRSRIDIPFVDQFDRLVAGVLVVLDGRLLEDVSDSFGNFFIACLLFRCYTLITNSCSLIEAARNRRNERSIKRAR